MNWANWEYDWSTEKKRHLWITASTFMTNHTISNRKTDTESVRGGWSCTGFWFKEITLQSSKKNEIDRSSFFIKWKSHWLLNKREKQAPSSQTQIYEHQHVRLSNDVRWCSVWSVSNCRVERWHRWGRETKDDYSNQVQQLYKRKAHQMIDHTLMQLQNSFTFVVRGRNFVFSQLEKNI